MKSLVWLTSLVLQECGTLCGVDPNFDLKKIEARVKSEGDSFLTISLPSYCKIFERCLAKGCVQSTDFVGYEKTRRSGGLPKLLSGFLMRIFDVDGVLLVKPDIEAIRSVRQITLLHKKVLLPCSKERENSASKSFEQVEIEIGLDQVDHTDISSVASYILADILRDVAYGDVLPILVPVHGGGAVVEGYSNNQKWKFQSWHTRLTEVGFTKAEFGPNYLHDSYHVGESGPCVSLELSPEQELPVKVIFVPKTMKTPRVIAIEPTVMQYAQQAILKVMVPRLERGRFTAGQLNFTDQTINQRLALLASKNGSLATIDMKEASDRVSYRMAEAVFKTAPDLWALIDSCRSHSAKLPNGKVIVLKKFASMGSALCFPVEALVFFCSIIASRLKARNLRPTSRRIFELSRDVYVFGDDIVVPVDEAPSIIGDLEARGLKVNADKSFWTGKFRESCGTDAYDGERVTPVYNRRPLSYDTAEPSSLNSLVELGNQLYQAGYWSTTRAIRELVESLYGTLPFLRRGSQGIGWRNFSDSSTFSRWNKLLHRFEVRAPVLSAKYRKDLLDGPSALLKCYGLIGSRAVDPQHLSRTARSWSLEQKTKWVPA